MRSNRTVARRLSCLAVALMIVAGCRVDDPKLSDLPNPANTARTASVQTIGYGHLPGQQVDIYRPAGRSNRRALLWFHGGAWQYGSKADVPNLSPVIMQLVNQGWAIVVADYRTFGATEYGSGETGDPVSLRDARAAFQWLQSSAPYLGIRDDRIIVGGESAGGTLAALIGTLDDGQPKPRGWLAIDAPMDLSELENRTTPKLYGVATPSRAVAAFLGCPFDATIDQSTCDRARVAAYSPLTHLDPSDPSGYLIGASLDEVAPVALHAGAMERIAESAGGPLVAFDLVDTGDPSHWGHSGSQWDINFSALSVWMAHTVR